MLSILSLLSSPFRNASHLRSSGPLQPCSHLFSPTFLHKETQTLFPWRGGKLRHSKVSSLALGWGRRQEYLLIWDGLICTGHFLICTRSIRRLLLPPVNELFRNYSDALCHQILITRSAFLAGLHGAVQAASQAPESQASSKYMHWLFLIMVGRHQLGSHLTSTSYHQRSISVSISTSPWSLQGAAPGSNPSSSPWTPSWEEPHIGGPLRSEGKVLLRLPAFGSTRYQRREAAGRHGCLG